MEFRINIISSAILVLLAVCVASCQRSGSDPVRIGFVADLSDRMSIIGSPGRDAAILAVEEVNRRGGIDGRSIELVYRDNKHSESRLLEQLKNLRRAGVEVVIGPMTSQMGVVAAKSSELQGMVFLSPTVSTPELSGINDNFFRVYPHSISLIDHLVAYLVKAENTGRVGVVLDTSNSAFSLPWGDYFVEQMSRFGFEVVPPFRFNPEFDPLYKNLVEKIEKAQIDTLLVVASATDLGIISQLMRQSGRQSDIFATEWSYSAELIQFGSKAANGIKLIHTFDEHSDDPSFIVFNKAFEDRFSYKPNFAAAYSYDATMVAISAMTTKNKIGFAERLILLGKFKGLQTTLQFDRFGDVERPVFLSEIVDGQFRKIGSI